MISSLISYVYSIFTHYAYTILGQRQPLSASISNLSTRDRESLLCEVSDSLHWHLPGVGDVGLGSSLEDGVSGGDGEISRDDGVASVTAELDAALDQCRLSVVKFEHRERFVSMRIQKYRMMLDRRRNERTNQDDVNLDLECDEFIESGNQSQSTTERNKKDEMALQSVEKVHKNLIAEIEVLRRRLRELEAKKDDYICLREECRDFVLAAAAE